MYGRPSVGAPPERESEQLFCCEGRPRRAAPTSCLWFLNHPKFDECVNYDGSALFRTMKAFDCRNSRSSGFDQEKQPSSCCFSNILTFSLLGAGPMRITSLLTEINFNPTQ